MIRKNDVKKNANGTKAEENKESLTEILEEHDYDSLDSLGKEICDYFDKGKTVNGKK